MIRVVKPSLQDQVWQGIFSQATAGRSKLIQEFQDTGDAKVDDKLYKRYMKFLLELFNDKCAYCETTISSNQPGDVEHFRPKGRVADDNFKPIKVRYKKWGEVDHPGYFWLAYDWDNLFPACIDCNRYRKHGTGADAGAGKADRFPVAGFRAHEPDDEVKEKPLLINPSKDEPGDHLEFLDTGEVVSKTEVGKETLHHLGLNRREVLVKARKLALKNAHALFTQYFNAVLAGGKDQEELRVRINDIWNGREPYTAMQRLGFEMIRKSFIAGGESTSRFRSSRIREQRRGASNVGCVEADRSGASFPDVPRRRRSRVRAGEDRVRARWGRCHQAGARRRQGVGCRPGDGCAAPFVSS